MIMSYKNISSNTINRHRTGGIIMTDVYDYVTLMCRLKAAQTRNKELESGERYVRLKELHQKECR